MGALRLLLGWIYFDVPVLPRWDHARWGRRRWPGLDSPDGSNLLDLAAGHLQGPAKTVTTDTDHLLSLVSER